MVAVIGTDEFEGWFLGLTAPDARFHLRMAPKQRRSGRNTSDSARKRGDTMQLSHWKDIRAKKLSPEVLRQVDEEVEQELLEMDLRSLREAAGLTQDELARRVEITQSQLSKLERREDHRISTLRRYVEALGGQLEIVAVVQGKRVRLSEG